MKENKKSNNSNFKYENYKKQFNDTLTAISNWKYIGLKEELEDIFNFENNEFLLFMNFSKLITLNIDLNYNDNKKIINNINKTRINIKNDNNNFYNHLFKIILHFHIFLLEKIAKNELNQTNHILTQNIFFIFKLYKEKLLDIKKIILYFNTVIYFINNKKTNSDKNIKIKIIILTELLIEKYFSSFLTLLFDINNKDDIILFFQYMLYALDLLNSHDFKNCFNIQIITRTKIIENFMRILLDSFNYNLNIEIYNNYKEKLINCFANIYKNNMDYFNFFESLIIQNKKSFYNLVNFTIRKELIQKDIYIQNFYIELLEKIFSLENNLRNDKNILYNYFLFNGYNSKMTFNLNEFSLNNSLIIFSFKLLIDIPEQNANIFPLIIFQSQEGIKITFKLYIEKENDKYKLNIYQEKGDKKKKNITLEKVGNIQLDINYIISIKILNRKISIYIIKLNEKNEKYFEEFDFFEVKNNTPILLKIGNDEENNEYFKGYIGTFIVMKNIEVKKNCKIEDFINYILGLKNLYSYFPFFLSNSSIYNLEEALFFSSNKEENEFNEIKKFLVNNIEKCNFEIYLSPKMMGIYYSLLFKNENKENCYLTEVPNITNSQKYKIINLNISLGTKSKIFDVFLRNNGFDYLILILEYYYHFFKLLESERDKFEFDLNNNEYRNIINKSIKNVILIINKYYTYYKCIIPNSKKYKTLFRNLHEILKLKNKGIFSSIFNDLFGFYIELNNELEILRNQMYKNIQDSNFIEYEKTLFNFSKGLMDIFFNYELYINIQEKYILNSLFLNTKSILNNYNNNYDFDKTFPFEEGFIFKLLNFAKCIENEFTNDYKNQNNIISSYFDLIKIYLESLDKKEINENNFRMIFKYVLINFRDNLDVIINILFFIYENNTENYIFGEEVIDILETFDKKPDKEAKSKENNDNNNPMDIDLIIFPFLLTSSFISNSKKIVNYLNSKLEKFIITKNSISNIITELKKNFEQFLIYKQTTENNTYNLNIKKMNLFGNIFDFIINLFNLIINNKKNKNISEENKNQSENIDNKDFLELLDFLFDLNNILKDDLIKKRNNINYIYCVLNFLIFFYRIINFESKILLYSDIKFTKLLIEVVDLCKNYYIINCGHFFKFKISNREYQKTIIEIIYELSINYFFNDENSVECYNILLDNYNFTFYDRQFLDNDKKSIFYVNDYLSFIIDTKKFKTNDNDLKYKIKTLKQYNEYFNNYEKFNGNMVTYFLNIIMESKEKINGEKNFKYAPSTKLSQFLDDLFNLMLEEHTNLYKISRKYFFHKFSPFYSTELIKYIKENYIKKKKL